MSFGDRINRTGKYEAYDKGYKDGYHDGKKKRGKYGYLNDLDYDNIPDSSSSSDKPLTAFGVYWMTFFWAIVIGYVFSLLGKAGYESFDKGFFGLGFIITYIFGNFIALKRLFSDNNQKNISSEIVPFCLLVIFFPFLFLLLIKYWYILVIIIILSIMGR